ncbi:Lsr2 family protein [Kutzneria viridogrisea]|uniref:Lsr2 protein n=1 Tax=Kutzneria viridogrisea TaxID=47990 RepID=A0ABR6BR98_9PSEU|nr:hypothetical protein [Kutzneria viridogrisea]
MAQKTVVHLIDDLDGGEADESLTFGLDGIEYAMDLSSENVTKLRDLLAPFVAAGRRVGGRKARSAGPVKTGASAVSDRALNQAIREWAREQGETISDRGRIPQDLVNRYQVAHA